MNRPNPDTNAASSVPQAAALSSRGETVALSDPSTGEPVEMPRFAKATHPGELGRLGKYRIQKELGRGGMGAVYLAFDERLQRRIALKVMLPKAAANVSAKERFLREARAAAQISSDHVVNIFEADEIDGIPYIALQYLQGYPLDEYLSKQGNPSIPQIIRIGQEAALGLEAAHQLGLVHRDIKPGNLWLEAPNGRVKILDFGLARQQADDAHLTRSGAVVGTPAYMSPEQGRGLAVDGRSDLFSLGGVLYRLCTGRLPFKGDTAMALLMSIGIDEPTPVRELNPNVPEPLANLIHRLLAKDPAHRPPTARAVADELNAIFGTSQTPAALSASVPQVIYVPMAIVADEANPFAGMTEGSSFASDSATEAEPDSKPLAASQPSRRFPTWLVAGVLLAVAGVVGFVVSQMGKKPVETVQPEPPEKKDPVRRDPKVEAPKPGEVFVLKFGNPQVEMKFRWIPPGKFSRGTPARDITISKGFWMAETECTQAQWRAIMKANPNPSKFKGDNLPVEMVSANDADEFCKELAKVTGKPIQLPSEAQWEYACRAGTTTEYHSGDGEEALRKAGWYGGNASGRTHPVGEKEANAWGLRDMHGNVWEWCLDGYEEKYYAESPATDPINTNNQTNARVVRGGSWGDNPGSCLAAYRHNHTPGGSYHSFGFRVCFRSDSGVIAPTKDPDRLAAEYALSIGGTVRINNENRDIKAVAELPAASFRLTFLHLNANKQATDAEMVNFKDCTDLVGLSLYGANVGDAGLVHFRDCKKLTIVTLGNTRVSDVGLGHFKDCKQLSQIFLDDTQVSDAGLKELAGRTRLTLLRLQRTKVTEAGVKQLAAALPECRIEWDGGTIEPRKSPDRIAAEYVLSIGGTVRINNENRDIKAVGELPKEPFQLTALNLTSNKQVTDAGLAVCKDCKNLTELTLANLSVGDVGLAHFKDCNNLVVLTLKGAQVTDAGLANFKECTKLILLNLENTQVSDTGLNVLLSKSSLVGLFLQKTKVTEAGVKQLAAALPQCRIEWDGGTIEPRKSPDRLAAEYVLSIGGTVRINNENRDIKAVSELPSTPFQLAQLILTDNKQVTDAGLAACRDCKNLTGLHLTNTQVSDVGVAYFKDCKTLTQLSLMNTQVTDVGLAHFKDCKKLALLGLTNTQVTDVGLAHFKDCKNLYTLSLIGTKTSDAGLAYFKDCTSLAHLHLGDTQASDAGLAHFKECKNLKQLGLMNTQVTDAGLKELVDKPNLTSVTLQKTKVTADGVKQLAAALPQCRIEWDGGFIEPKKPMDRTAAEYVLSIGGTIKINENRDIKLAAELPKEAFRLSAVDLLDNKQVTDEGLAVFKTCNLKHLNLGGTAVTDAGLANFKDHKELSSLWLGNMKVTDVGLANFKDCTRLVELHLYNTQVGDAGLSHFKDCKNLEVLNLDDTKVTDAGLVHLRGCKNLAFLNLDRGPFTDAALKELMDKPKLGYLNVKQTKVTEAGAKQLSATLPECKIEWAGGTIEPRKSPDRKAAEYVISVGGVVLVDGNKRDIKVVGGLPPGPFRLTDVSLRSNGQFTDEGLSVFKDCKNLTRLDLGVTKVTDAGLVHFKDCKNLLHLQLYATAITDAGMVHFKDCKNLTFLSLHATAITDAGLAHFKDCKNLTDVQIGCKGVTDAGLANFKDCKDVTLLDVSGSQVSDAGLSVLLDKPKLVDLRLKKTKVTAAGIETLKKALTQCKIEWDGGIILPKAAVDVDRKAAEYVLSIGGEVRVNDQTSSIKAVAGLPKEPFQLNIALLHGNKQVSEEGLAAFKDCKNLKVLLLTNTPIGDAGLAHFKNCKGLTDLRLGDTPLSNAGLANFADCKNLATLFLHGTQVSDAGLAHFKDCTSLNWIDLNNTKVGDPGLLHFKELKSLTYVDLRKTKVTAAGVKTLSEALPECKIEWDGGIIEPAKK